MAAITVSFPVWGGGLIDKVLHFSCPAVDQDYIDAAFDGVAPLCLEVSFQCPDLHSEESSADETRASFGNLMHVCVFLNSCGSMRPLTRLELK